MLENKQKIKHTKHTQTRKVYLYSLETVPSIHLEASAFCIEYRSYCNWLSCFLENLDLICLIIKVKLNIEQLFKCLFLFKICSVIQFLKLFLRGKGLKSIWISCNKFWFRRKVHERFFNLNSDIKGSECFYLLFHMVSLENENEYYSIILADTLMPAI